MLDLEPRRRCEGTRACAIPNPPISALCSVGTAAASLPAFPAASSYTLPLSSPGERCLRCRLQLAEGGMIEWRLNHSRQERNEVRCRRAVATSNALDDDDWFASSPAGPSPCCVSGVPPLAAGTVAAPRTGASAPGPAVAVRAEPLSEVSQCDPGC